MRTLHITVNNKVATYLTRDGNIVCGNSDYQIAFAFDSEWSAYESKVARFIWNNKYVDVTFTGNTVTVPKISKTNLLKVGVYAGDLSTTTSAEIPCVWSVLCESATAGSGDTPGTGGTVDLSNYYTKSEINALLEAIETGGTPQGISTEAEMTALLETAEVGSVYKYTGESGTYENGAYYVVESEGASGYTVTVTSGNGVLYVFDDSKAANFIGETGDGETVEFTITSGYITIQGNTGDIVDYQASDNLTLVSNNGVDIVYAVTGNGTLTVTLADGYD